MLSNSVQLSSKLSNTANDVSKLNKRIGSLEQEYQSLSSSLSNEINSRINQDNNTKATNEALSLKISTLKEGMNSLTQIVSESIDDFKSNITKDITNKNQTLQDAIESKVKKIDFYDKQSRNTNYQFDTKQKDTNQKLSVLEKQVNEQLKTYKEDLNTNLVHIEFIEKKLNDNYTIIKTDIANITKELIIVKNEIIALKQFKTSSFETTQYLKNDIMKQEETMSKFKNRINIITTEIQNKMSAFENTFSNQSKSMSSLKEEIDKHLNGFDNALNAKIKEVHSQFDCHKVDVCKEIESFEKHIISEQDKFNAYIQNIFEDHTIHIKKLCDYITVDISQLKDNTQLMNNNIQILKREVFTNLNEVEEFLTKKYESLFNIINNDLNDKC